MTQVQIPSAAPNHTERSSALGRMSRFSWSSNYAGSDFTKGVTAECKRVADTGHYGWIARRHFEDIIFGISPVMVLFLMASVLAIVFYTVT